jgi:hypothetical protein
MRPVPARTVSSWVGEINQKKILRFVKRRRYKMAVSDGPEAANIVNSVVKDRFQIIYVLPPNV